MTTEPRAIAFASDAYFDLLSANPDLGKALALGEEMIIVIDGEAYRITGEGETATGGTPSIPSPDTGDVVAQTDNESGTEVTPQTDSATGTGLQICGLGMALPLLVVGGLGASRRRKKA